MPSKKNTKIKILRYEFLLLPGMFIVHFEHSRRTEHRVAP